MTTVSKLAWCCFLIGATAAIESAVAAPVAPTLVGNWYGIGEPGDPDIFYIDSFHGDGTFNAEYRKCEKGKVIYRQTQSGRWRFADGVLTLNSTVINGLPGRFDHYYTIVSMNLTEFQARLHEPDFLFVEKRVPNFEFPPCYLGS